MFTDSPRLIDRVRAEPYPAHASAEPREGYIGSGQNYINAAKLSRAQSNSNRSCEVRIGLRYEHCWEAVQFEGQTFYYTLQKVVN